MPRSNNQTSPRVAVILFSVKHSKEFVGGANGLLVIQRTRIERNRPAQEFHGESPFFLFRERLERFQKLVCLPAHTLRLALFASRDKCERPARPARGKSSSIPDHNGVR